MKRTFVLFALILVLLAPAFAQGRGRQLSADDQRRFDSYFSRWQDYRRTNNQGEMRSMEKRMQDVYRRYGIPSDTPYGRIASNGGGPQSDRDRDWDRDRDRDWDRDRDRDWDRERDRDREWDRDRRADWDRYRDRDRAYWHQNQRLSGEDQGRFDSYFQRWQNYRRTNNRDEVISMEKRMFDVYDHYGIPHDVPFERVASQGARY
jgi:hypothetical protein